MEHLILIQTEPTGAYTAQAVGLPDIRVSASTREEAIHKVRESLNGLVAAGRLVTADVAEENPALQWAAWAKGDPDYQVFLDELKRNRKKNLAPTPKDQDVGNTCPDSSSTPTT